MGTWNSPRGCNQMLVRNLCKSIKRQKPPPFSARTEVEYCLDLMMKGRSRKVCGWMVRGGIAAANVWY